MAVSVALGKLAKRRKPLRHNKYGLWRYRVEDTRIICQIREQETLVLVLRVGHRKNIYRCRY